MANGMPQLQPLLIRFRGICAHLDMNGNGNGNGHAKDGTKGVKKKKRTILLRHRSGNSNIEHHIPYIEFYADDLESVSPDLVWLRYSRPNTDGTFGRVDIPEGTEIEIQGLKPGEVEEDASYTRDVTRFSDILKTFSKENQKVDQALLKEVATLSNDTRVAAVFNMPDGRLFAGEPEAMITRFPEEVGFTARRLARWTDLRVELTEPQLVIKLLPLGNGTNARKPQEIRFKDTIRMITIGNEPERLILGLIGSAVQDQPTSHGINHASGHDSMASPTQPTGHFILYYELLQNPPDSPPLPIPTQLTGSGCPNHNAP